MNRAIWRVLETPSMDGAWNMAVDESLMLRAATTGECVFRIYSWQQRTLSFGRNQRATGLYNPLRLKELGINCVRRPTGGRAVLHFNEVTYSVTAPQSGLGGLGESFGRINAILLHALEMLGVSAALQSGRKSRPTGANANISSDHSAEPPAHAVAPEYLLGPSPCFDTPGMGEVVSQGRKLVGSAQWRDGAAILQHGSILIQDDQKLIAAVREGANSHDVPPATLADSLGYIPSFAVVAAALRRALVTLEQEDASPLHVDEVPQDALAQSLKKYRDDEWTWRR